METVAIEGWRRGTLLLIIFKYSAHPAGCLGISRRTGRELWLLKASLVA